MKGPVEGFVGSIPSPTLDSRIYRNHLAGDFHDLLNTYQNPKKCQVQFSLAKFAEVI